MTDFTDFPISAAPLESPGADEADLRRAVNRLAPSAEAITTGAAPITLDPLVRVYKCTTGGTGGIEVVDLPDFDLTDGGGTVNIENIGARVVIALDVQTDPADVVKVTVNGSGDDIDLLGVFRLGHLRFGSVSGGIILDYPGAAVSLIWCANQWQIEVDQNGFNYTSSHIDTVEIIMNAGQHIGGTGQPITLGGGTGDSTHAGGEVRAIAGDGGVGGADHYVRGGNCTVAGPGGSVYFFGGNTPNGTPGGVGFFTGYDTTSGTYGPVKFWNPLPTADPHDAGALFTDGPIVAGTPMQLWMSGG